MNLSILLTHIVGVARLGVVKEQTGQTMKELWAIMRRVMLRMRTVISR